MQEKPETPMCNRLAACRAARSNIEDFVDWCRDQGCVLIDEGGAVCRMNDLLNRFFEIDPKVLEDERRALLDWQTEIVNKGGPVKGGPA